MHGQPVCSDLVYSKYVSFDQKNQATVTCNKTKSKDSTRRKIMYIYLSINMNKTIKHIKKFFKFHYS